MGLGVAMTNLTQFKPFTTFHLFAVRCILSKPIKASPTAALYTGVQVYRSEGGMFLLVTPGRTYWRIRASVEGTGAAMCSASAPLCPGSRRAATSDRMKQNNWEYSDSGWKEGDITVSCPVHT